MRTTALERLKFKRIGTVIKGSGAFLIALAAGIILFSILISVFEPPPSFFAVFANIALVLACFVGSRTIARIRKQGGIKIALIFSAILILLMIILPPYSFSFPVFFGKSALIIISSLIGGISGVQ
jgi:putative membrane protein (TIGR04086 family)